MKDKTKMRLSNVVYLVSFSGQLHNVIANKLSYQIITSEFHSPRVSHTSIIINEYLVTLSFD